MAQDEYVVVVALHHRILTHTHTPTLPRTRMQEKEKKRESDEKKKEAERKKKDADREKKEKVCTTPV